MSAALLLYRKLKYLQLPTFQFLLTCNADTLWVDGQIALRAQKSPAWEAKSLSYPLTL